MTQRNWTPLFSMACAMALISAAACGGGDDDDAETAAIGEGVSDEVADDVTPPQPCTAQDDCAANPATPNLNCRGSENCSICDASICKPLWTGVKQDNLTNAGFVQVNYSVDSDLLKQHPNCFRRFALIHATEPSGATATCATVLTPGTPVPYAVHNVMFLQDDQTEGICGAAGGVMTHQWGLVPRNQPLLFVGELLSSSAGAPAAPAGTADVVFAQVCREGLVIDAATLLGPAGAPTLPVAAEFRP